MRKKDRKVHTETYNGEEEPPDRIADPEAVVEGCEGEGQGNHHAKARENRAGYKVRREDRCMPARELSNGEVERYDGMN